MDSINGWAPPIVTQRRDYQTVARIVTQTDVDRWVEIERKYTALCLYMKQDVIPLLLPDDA